jgi:Mn2+/Fe2+ NRAMP family transporter
VGVFLTIFDSFVILAFELIIGFKFLKIFIGAMIGLLSCCSFIMFYDAPKEWDGILYGFFIPSLNDDTFYTVNQLLSNIKGIGVNRFNHYAL